MSEQELIDLGFEKNFLEPESKNYYYNLDITGGLSFITNSDDEINDDNWYAEFFDTEIPVRYNDYDKLKKLINLIKDGTENKIF